FSAGSSTVCERFGRLKGGCGHDWPPHNFVQNSMTRKLSGIGQSCPQPASHPASRLKGGGGQACRPTTPQSSGVNGLLNRYRNTRLTAVIANEYE
ncbi:MAG: hypothetical protein ACLP59_03900, partial [Bryobacteraceae bacterium]